MIGTRRLWWAQFYWGWRPAAASMTKNCRCVDWSMPTPTSLPSRLKTYVRGNARDVEELVHGAVGIDENRRMIIPWPEELAYLEWILIGDGENHQALRLVMGVDDVEIGHLRAAGRAPCGPEIDHDNLAAQLRTGSTVCCAGP